MHFSVLRAFLLLLLAHLALAKTIPLEELLYNSKNVCTHLEQSFLSAIHNMSAVTAQGDRMPLDDFRVDLYLSLVSPEGATEDLQYQIDYIIQFSNQSLQRGLALVANRKLLTSSTGQFYASGGEHFKFVFPTNQLCNFIRGIYITFEFQDDPFSEGYVLSHNCDPGSLAFSYGKHCLKIDFESHPVMNLETCIAPSTDSVIRRGGSANKLVSSCCKKYINSQYEGHDSKCYTRHTLNKINNTSIDLNIGVLLLLTAVGFILFRVFLRLRIYYLASSSTYKKIKDDA
ncbi:hypothetical protein BABINDRAFT_160823 [Babjeviella inositovora NRRL Y-12698]|uniref:Uncharacterized protein n=1 Tax=Babjeviella inositovora NRRL Y-12698 TaxID=984486 RepID=A0A1E3QSE1_9ASCO|nr:uncharacterized protein BABINDRAFT_160823 [Babjeviella inositovora NRRL Y-12698]ODQ80558.1 hypothetical protein BABINDRAFT_160823 [Babjeviella inositovora NRRL Y-12698]